MFKTKWRIVEVRPDIFELQYKRPLRISFVKYGFKEYKTFNSAKAALILHRYWECKNKVFYIDE